MLRRIRDRNIWVIYATIVLLGIAYGTSIAVLAVHLDAHHIPELAMGGLAASFALGIVSFSIPAGWLVRRAGAKVTLIGALAGYAICVCTFPYLDTLVGLSVARFFDGAFSVGVWVAAETALLARSDRENKGLVMSLYAISLAIGYVIGPLVASGVARVWGTGAAFLVAGGLALAAIAVVVFALERKRQGTASADRDREVEAPRSTSGQIFWRTKTSCFATFSYGYFQASVVLFLPLYLIRAKQVPPDRTILVTAFFAAGMLAMSSWAGRLGDKHGHLLVMRVLGAIGGAMVASFVVLPSFPLMCAAVFVAGATLASISPVSLALQGVVTPAHDLERANAFYNAAYAAGMLVGPALSGLLFKRYGGAAMLFHLAALWACFVALTVVFAGDDPSAQRRQASLLLPR
ncbi:MAG: MFS transporter [Labilithrix sp.]|nr:MFS transporter [Labilithrix sp.]